MENKDQQPQYQRPQQPQPQYQQPQYQQPQQPQQQPRYQKPDNLATKIVLVVLGALLLIAVPLAVEFVQSREWDLPRWLGGSQAVEEQLLQQPPATTAPAETETAPPTTAPFTTATGIIAVSPGGWCTYALT